MSVMLVQSGTQRHGDRETVLIKMERIFFLFKPRNACPSQQKGSGKRSLAGKPTRRQHIPEKCQKLKNDWPEIIWCAVIQQSSSVKK